MKGLFFFQTPFLVKNVKQVSVYGHKNFHGILCLFFSPYKREAKAIWICVVLRVYMFSLKYPESVSFLLVSAIC